VAERLAASKEGLSSVELVTYTHLLLPKPHHHTDETHGKSKLQIDPEFQLP
jgi:hypothetical protein